jgi:hypothetical protein
MNYPRFALPDTLADLWDAALADLETVERMPGVVVEMATWYDVVIPEDHDGKAGEPVCHLCAAGAMIHQRANLPAGSIFVSPEDFPDDVARKLKAVNYMRYGHLILAFRVLKKYADASLPDDVPDIVTMTPYDEDRSAFWERARALSALLHTAGL